MNQLVEAGFELFLRPGLDVPIKAKVPRPSDLRLELFPPAVAQLVYTHALCVLYLVARAVRTSACACLVRGVMVPP